MNRTQFKKHVRVEENGCWTWIRHKRRGGYGGCRRLGEVYAHRVSWRLFRGAIPPRMKVLHRCDNPPCVNPKHLFIGTQKDNMQDMSRKRRNSVSRNRGEQHPQAKLTDRDVVLVKTARRFGLKLKEIALVFGVSVPTVSMVASGQRRAA